MATAQTHEFGPRRVHTGQPVMTYHGLLLGTVVDIRPDGFKLETPTGDYWIHADAVYEIDADRVRLECGLRGLDGYRYMPSED